MIFVTVGSQKFQFDRLLRAVDACVESKTIEGEVFAQTGWCTYIPENYMHEAFLDRDSFAAEMARAEAVVTHGGTGAIVSALKAGKRVVAVPRLARYGEHVDDHQVQIVKQFSDAGLITACEDTDDLAKAYIECLRREPALYSSNTGRFLADLDEYLSSLRVAKGR